MSNFSISTIVHQSPLSHFLTLSSSWRRPNLHPLPPPPPFPIWNTSHTLNHEVYKYMRSYLYLSSISVCHIHKLSIYNIIVMVIFNCQLDAVNKSLERLSMKDCLHCLGLWVCLPWLTWCSKTQPTVSGTVPYAGGSEQCKSREIQLNTACKQAHTFISLCSWRCMYSSWFNLPIPMNSSLELKTRVKHFLPWVASV